MTTLSLKSVCDTFGTSPSVGAVARLALLHGSIKIKFHPPCKNELDIKNNKEI
jgi:hypothetical protein